MSYKIKVIESDRLKTIELYTPTDTSRRDVHADILINKKSKTAEIQIPRNGDYQNYPVDFNTVIGMNEHELSKFMFNEVTKW